MSFKGRNSSIVSEAMDKGINGVSAINAVENGYCLLAENVDIGQPGRVQKRAGYHLFAQRLPLRSKSITVSGGVSRVLFDVIPLTSIEVSLYSNTALNATITNDALFYRTNDAGNTIFATFITAEEITRDTLFSAIGSDGVERCVQPLEVFSSTGLAKVLLPQYVATWWTGVVLSDTAPSVQKMRTVSGKSLAKISEKDISGFAVAQTVPFRVRVSFPSTSAASEVKLGATVMFETCLRKLDDTPVCGTVIATGLEYIDVETEVANAVFGEIDQNYFQMRYINAKHIGYNSANYNWTVANAAHAINSSVWGITLRDVSSIYIAQSLCIGTQPSTDVQEVGFIYGLRTDAGTVGLLGKYFDVDKARDRVVCGVDGYIFSEEDHPTPLLPTVVGLVYTGVSGNITANITNDTLTIPLAGAGNVYLPGDVITVRYADGTYSNAYTGDSIITETRIVDSVNPNSLVLEAHGVKKFFIREGTRWTFTRKSTRIYTSNALSFLPILPGMTLQYEVENKLLPVYEIKDCDYTVAKQYVELDTEIEWSSDTNLVMSSVFRPVKADVSCTYSVQQGINSEANAISAERTTVFACGLSGMWRYNGVQLLNMRIPRTASGYIRNVPGTGGSLKLDTQEDGTKTGRVYAFVVTYSYSELVNGKLVTFESGLNPVSTYKILSEQDDLKSQYSRLVELQVPSIPRGIGLPAEDMLINVYRTPSGTLLTEPSAEVYLLERQVSNNPDVPFTTIIAGTEAPLVFTASNYKALYASVTGDSVNDELKREVVDPPLSTTISTLESRIIAASGYDHPYISFICNDVFSTTDNTFKAHFDITYAPPQISETAYRFISCPCNHTTTSGTGGAKDGAFGGVGLPFQIVGVDTYKIKKVTYTDNSCFFKITSATIANGTQYLLRLSNGKYEAISPGTADPYYNGYDLEGQVFTGTSTAQQVSAVTKWKKVDALGAVIPLTETLLVFEKFWDVTTISTTNGLVIIGNTALDSTGAIQFLLYTSATLIVGDYIILKGLGTTGQCKDATGKVLSFDRDLIMEVMSGSSPFVLRPLKKGITINSHFTDPGLRTAISVSNAATGVICEPFSIFKLQTTTARATSDWSVSPTTSEIQLMSSPLITPTAGDYVCIDGLPSETPPGSGFRYNGSLEVVSLVGDKLTVKVTPPESAKGVLTQDFTTEAKKGSLVWTKGSVIDTPDAVQVRLTATTLTVPVTKDDYIYLITRGESPDVFCLALTGVFKVKRVTSDFVTWQDTLAIGAAIAGVEIYYQGAIDYFALSGASFTKAIFAGRSGDGVTTQLRLHVPVPVVSYRDGSQDITGILYSAIDGYTPLERVVKPLSHAMNCVLWNEGFTYWGGRVGGNVEGAHPGNVIPTNGIKFMPHLNPDNTYRNRYYVGDIASTSFEPMWQCVLQPSVWRVEGSKQKNIVGTSYAREDLYTVAEYRPSRLWYTNPTGTLVGQAFRELSDIDIDSQDGERITGLAPFQTYSLLAKQNSLWRLSFGGSESLKQPNKVPGSVGASCHKNMVATERGVFLLHDTGLYISDGTTCESIHQVKRIFDERVIQNRQLFSLTAGYHDPLGKTVYLGVPLSEDEQTLTDTIDGQFVFNYSLKSITLDSVTSGWTVNTGLSATAWVGVYNDVYFSSTNGAVFRFRTEKGATKYSDERRAITSRVRTRYVFADDNMNGRFLKGLYFQLGKSTGIAMKISMAWDFFKAYTQIQEFNMPVDSFGASSFGSSYFGSDKFMENRRKTPDQLRVNQFSIELLDDTLDSSGEIYGMYVESEETSLKLINQGNTR